MEIRSVCIHTVLGFVKCIMYNYIIIILFKSFLADRRSRQTPKPPGAPTGTQDPGPSHTLTILIALCRILHYQRILATVTTGGGVRGGERGGGRGDSRIALVHRDLVGSPRYRIWRSAPVGLVRYSPAARSPTRRQTRTQTHLRLTGREGIG